MLVLTLQKDLMKCAEIAVGAATVTAQSLVVGLVVLLSSL